MDPSKKELNKEGRKANGFQSIMFFFHVIRATKAHQHDVDEKRNATRRNSRSPTVPVVPSNDSAPRNITGIKSGRALQNF